MPRAANSPTPLADAAPTPLADSEQRTLPHWEHAAMLEQRRKRAALLEQRCKLMALLEQRRKLTVLLKQHRELAAQWLCFELAVLLAAKYAKGRVVLCACVVLCVAL